MSILPPVLPRLLALTLALLGVRGVDAMPHPASPTPAPAAPHRVQLPDDAVPTAYRLRVTPDAAAGRFAGEVDIDLDVRRATRRLVLNAAELVIDEARVDDRVTPTATALDGKHETATFTFARALPPGRHVFHLRYRGPVRQQASGLFALRESGDGGAAAREADPMLFTQFENSDARRFLPCWDEPARKATFSLEVTVPSGLTAIGNMPVADDAALPDGRHRVRFQATPRMSTYLLFLAVGDFERVHRQVAGTDVGVVVRRGQAARAAYALDAAAEVLPWMNRWFGIDYPLPKLDLVAGPGANPGFGAMENWGAIFFFEQDLLVDPSVSTEADRRNVYATVAHEIAHQWFGNLVTMDWWDDLWLNEGFASWMSAKAAQALHPAWGADLDGVRAAEWAMAVDQREGTHPVVLPIADVLQADGAFDAITYGKGSAVVRQLEATVGEERFRTGVQRYLRAHAGGNATSDDLFSALDAVAERPVTPMAHDFTRQPGVPLVTELASSCEGDHTMVTLAQGRFRDDVAAADGAAPASGRGAGTVPTWRVPVTLAVLGDGDAARGPVVHAVVAGPAPQRLRVPGCGALLVDPGRTGYFRTRYTPATQAALLDRFDRLAPADQLGLLQDTAALARAGRAPMGRWLSLLARVPVDAEPTVLQTMVDQLRSLERLARGLPVDGPLRAFALDRLRPVAARAEAALAGARAEKGGLPSDSAAANLAVLHEAVTEALSDFGDPDLVAAARARFARWREDPASLGPAERRATLQVVADHARPEDWEALRALATRAGSHLERRHYVALLGSPRNPELAERALQWSLSDEVPATLVADLIGRVADRHPEAAFRLVASHWHQLGPRFDTSGAAIVVPHLLDTANRSADIALLEDFARGRVPAGARQDIRKVEAAIRVAERERRERVPEMQAWLARAGGPRAEAAARAGEQAGGRDASPAPLSGGADAPPPASASMGR